MQNNIQQTLVLIKPDALKNSLTGYVLSQLSEFHTSLMFAAAKVVRVTNLLAEAHYAEHRGKVFFDSLIEMITGQIHYPNDPSKQRVIAIVYDGPDAIATIRQVCGPTNPHIAREQRPGSIRSLGTVVPIFDGEGKMIGDRMDNLIHASANPEDAEREIKLWFKPTDMPPPKRAFATTHSEEHYYFVPRRVSVSYMPGSLCLLAPGDVVWTSDLEVLHALLEGKPAAYSLEAAVAKYLQNRRTAENW